MLRFIIVLFITVSLSLPLSTKAGSPFKERVSAKYAKGFEITYTSTTKLVEIKDPWQDADVIYRYLLVQRGCEVPDTTQAATVIEIPVRRIVSLSTTNIPNLDELGLLPRLVGVGDSKLIFNPEIRELIGQGKISEVGWSTTINVERLLMLQPDLVLTFAIGQSGMDDLERLKQYDIPTVLMAEYLEENPLGRAEWIKILAAFANREEQANRIFSNIEKSYLDQVEQVRHLKKPTVFTGSEYRGIWRVPGGASYLAALLRDAGADYLWSGNDKRGSLILDFESVYEKAWQADFWLNPGAVTTLEELLAAGPRYEMFNAVKNRTVFNNNARRNPQGGNDYWDTGLAKPHLLLADLIKIFHPEVNPEHDLIWYHKLD